MENGSNGAANGQDFLRAENLVKRFGAVEVLQGHPPDDPARLVAKHRVVQRGMRRT